MSTSISEFGVLHAGVGRCDITPAPGTPQGGWGAQTHERGIEADMPMEVRALALAQADLRILIVDADAIGFDAEWTEKIVAAISELTKIDRRHIRFSCSHTHAGPNTFRLKNISTGLDMATSYLEGLPLRIAGAAWQALQKMRPVRIGAGVGTCEINRNRRVKSPEGETVVGVNEEVPADHSLGVIRIDNEDGDVHATVVHYSCHPTTCGWQNERFSPDYPGPMRQTVERELGGTCLFLQGAAGDLGPRRGFTGDLNVYRQLGHELGLAAAAVAGGIHTREERQEYQSLMPSGANIAQYRYVEAPPLQPVCTMVSQTLQLPIRELGSQEKIAHDLELLRKRVQELRDAGETEAMRLMQARATQMGWRMENARLYSSRTHAEWPMQVIRLGEIALVSVAGEPFSSIGTRIREQSPARYTFVSGYSNGGFGYIPDREAYTSGGYEVEATPFSEEAADVVVESALKILNELFGETREA
ncbi:MAG: hypothetical protein JST61_02615 [Acidobacteria bacterium]|nr:hypothetical protein [Acidobacteriota bacterium]